MKLACNQGATENDNWHFHESIEEAAVCWGEPALYVWGGPILPGVPAVPAATATPVTTARWEPPPTPVPIPRWYHDPSTSSQHWKVGKEGGSVIRAKGFTKGQCTEYIDALINKRAPKEPDPEDADDPTPVSPAPTPRSSGQRVNGYWVAKAETVVLVPLLENVPDGRFAVQMTDEGHTFMRVVRPKNGTWKDCLKVQTQHGDRWEDAWCKWPDGKVGVFKVSVEDYINLLVCDWRGATRAYAKLKSVCSKCGKALTDERSRHYGIGPECERYWPEMITIVDEETELARGEK